jgi:hypothetical protein
MTRIDTIRPGRIAHLEAAAICGLSLLLLGCDPAQTNSAEAWDSGIDGMAGLARGTGSTSGSCGVRDCTSSSDNDCNGKADNTELDYCRCPAGGSPRPCTTGLSGICSAGSQPCVLSSDKSSSDWGTTCTLLTPKGTETCANLGTDDDCDGTVDNIAVSSCNVGTGLGACANGGTTTCSGTTQVCSPAVSGIGGAMSWHDSSAPNGSWDWDCDGTVTKYYPDAPPSTPNCSGLGQSDCKADTSQYRAYSNIACGALGTVYTRWCEWWGTSCGENGDETPSIQTCR